jgi:lipopolysaccharide/colanic/teichoic acid biosynthesis glycosyltransferase
MIASAEDIASGGVPIAPVGPLPDRVRGAVKRGLDIAVSCALLPFALAIVLVAAATVRLCHGVAPFYGHERVGKGGRRFRCWKLRTMAGDAEARLAAHLATSPAAAREWATSRKLRADPRVLGRTGGFLRRTSLDELPQLWNVLRGEMSLVGPRPVVAEELDHYGGQLDWYLAVRPGITGPWQVGGRSEVGYAIRVRLDVAYARAPSLRRDLALLARTLTVPFARRGAY